MQKYWLPVIHAALDLRKGKGSKAVDDLEPAAAIELGNSSPLTLYPAYVRGQAYLLVRNESRAAAEFQKFIDHPGIVLDFLTLWKDADPNIPILKQAKAEYSKLAVNSDAQSLKTWP